MFVAMFFDKSRSDHPAGPWSAKVIEITDGNPENDRVLYESGSYQKEWDAYDSAYFALQSIKRRESLKSQRKDRSNGVEK